MTDVIFWDVDTQYDFIHSDGKLYVPGSEQIVPVLGRLTELARVAGIRVVASADDHTLDDAEISDDPDYMETFPPHCMRETGGQEKIRETRLDDPEVIRGEKLESREIERIVADGRDILILKQRFDVFSNPNTEPLLATLDPRRIVLYGVALDVCNRFAVEGILQRMSGVRLQVVSDAVRPIDPEAGQLLLEDWRGRGVELTTSDRLIEELQTTSAS